MPVECEVAPLVRGLLKSDIRPDERGVERPSLIRDKSAPGADLLAGPPLRRMSEDPEAIAREIESYLLAHAPKHDAISLKAREIVELAENDREIVSVSRLAHMLRLSVRSVQDICQRALGVSPKWLIRCFRLQDALARLGVGSDVNLSALAQELGYFDQAHFTRDFNRVTGVSPSRY
jgi:AraC-like DNA-binding protein